MTGDTSDIFARLKNALPLRWFGPSADSLPVLDSVLWGIASLLSFVYGLYAYAKLQTRILTATDGWLDLIAYDFFGGAIVRLPGQSDASFRATILANMFRAKTTRASISDLLTQLTGVAPTIIETWRPADTGAYGSLATPSFGPCGYGVAGAYGSAALPNQFFVMTARGLPGVTDADLYAAIDATKATGTLAWVTIDSGVLPPTFGADGFLAYDSRDNEINGPKHGGAWPLGVLLGGDGTLLTFAIDPATGELSLTAAANYTGGTFALDANGNLGVTTA